MKTKIISESQNIFKGQLAKINVKYSDLSYSDGLMLGFEGTAYASLSYFQPGEKLVAELRVAGEDPRLGKRGLDISLTKKSLVLLKDDEYFLKDIISFYLSDVVKSVVQHGSQAREFQGYRKVDGQKLPSWKQLLGFRYDMLALVRPQRQLYFWIEKMHAENEYRVSLVEGGYEARHLKNTLVSQSMMTIIDDAPESGSRS
jgi:hypothetical protein